jgi:hypothetical protein
VHEVDFPICYKMVFFTKHVLNPPFYQGVATTNNAIESFNNVVKRNYTFGVRHSLVALFDLMLAQI